MQIKSALAALLLVAPSLIAAAPAPVSANEPAYFARQQTCNAPVPTDPAELQKYNDKQTEMAAATVEAHRGENMCKPGDFIKSKNKQEKQRIKDKCVDGYTICVTQRKKANQACKDMGGTVDQGHKDALKFCQDKKKEWSGKKI